MCLEAQSEAAIGELTRPPQAIVVLSAGLRRSSTHALQDTVGPLTLERLRRAAALQRATGLPLLVTGGKFDSYATSVAAAMTDSLTSDFGVPVRWVETASRNTFENAQFSAAILHPEDIRSVYLVTHPWHMPRAREAFERTGTATTPAAAAYSTSGVLAPTINDLIPNSRALEMSAYAIHEYVGRLWYQARYY